MNIRVFIVDDHQLIIDGLSEMLADQEGIELTGTALNGNEALTKIPIVQPDIVLLDLEMPEKNGFQVLERLKNNEKEIKVAILSMHLEKALLTKAIKLGVDGYLPKTVDKSELILAIKNIHEGRKHFSSDVTLGLAGHERQAIATDTFLLSELSPREKEVLAALAMGKTNKDIAESLNISTFTVETHRKHIMRKLDAHNVADLIRVAYRSKLIE